MKKTVIGMLHTLPYEDAVEEVLRFGGIDSLVHLRPSRLLGGLTLRFKYA